MHKLVIIIGLLAVSLGSFSTALPQTKTTSDEKDLRAKIARFAPTVITADVAKLSANDRKALDKIIAAARLFDPLYVRQVWSGNEALLKKLEADRSPLGKLRLHYFHINKGPWSQLDENVSFLPEAPSTKPPNAGHYPDDMTKEEFTAWADTLSPEEKAKANGFFYAIRRDADKKLTAVPYSQVYREFLAPAADLLRRAATLTSNPTLKDFLNKRAKAFLSDDYYESDLAWMDLDAPIDVTIGPYETYSDELFSNKAAFEAYVTIRDEAESDKLKRFSQYLQELENNIPIDPKYRNPKIGALSPIRVGNVVFSSGEGNNGVQTAAFNLPNDEKVISEKGSKRVMLKNIQNAKFEKTLIPISKVVLSPADRANLSFEAFFTHILMHELMHGLGPHNIKVNGADTTVRAQLKETYSTLEEAKADISGLCALQYLVDKGVLDKGLEKTMYTTFLASCFRSVRFGVKEAHGRGIAIQFNYLTDQGGIAYDKATNTFTIVPAKIKDAVRKLTTDIMTLQAEGSYEKAKAMFDTFGVIRPEMRAAMDKLNDVPVDIEPSFPLAEKIR
jgi:Peptidase family M49